MGNIGLRDVHAGMVLGADVVATGSRLLLKAGAELTDDDLRVFLMWGVVEIDVEGLCRADLAARAAARLAPSEVAAIEARIRALFRHNDPRHPVIDELVRIATLRLIRRAGEDVHAP